MRDPKSLRYRLFLWYVGSLTVLAIFFYSVVHVLMLPNGSIFFILLFLTLAVLGFSTIYRITKSISDLTSQIQKITWKNLNKRIKGIKSEDEIGELSRTFNKLLDHLDGTFKREQQFIADMTHEMKTPIATLQSMFEVTLTRERDTSEYKKVLSEGIEETKRMSHTLANILDLAWTETPNEQQKLQKCNVSDLLNELIELTKRMTEKKKINVKHNTTKDIFVLGNREKLARAFLNLIDNAIKYTPEKGTIALTLQSEKGKAIIVIKDTGQGIEGEDIPHIFDRFYRGSKTSKVFGSGLGLAICKSIISLHSGHIHVKSKPGKGSEFDIVLPLLPLSS